MILFAASNVSGTGVETKTTPLTSPNSAKGKADSIKIAMTPAYADSFLPGRDRANSLRARRSRNVMRAVMIRLLATFRRVKVLVMCRVSVETICSRVERAPKGMIAKKVSAGSTRTHFLCVQII